MNALIETARLAKQSTNSIKNLTLLERNNILEEFAQSMNDHSSQILSKNEIDIRNAREKGISENMIDRLTLSEKRIQEIAQGIRDLITLEDPLGIVLEERELSSGLHLKKISVPIGVIGIIYESRPNVTADCAALCIKSGNACILKSGSDSFETSSMIVQLCQQVLQRHNVDPNSVSISPLVSHEETEEFMACREYVDLLIPRGSKRLIQSVVNHAKVPVIETGAGICHVYVENSANHEMAEKIVINAKCQRPSVCNAAETLLVQEEIAKEWLPHMAEVFHENHVLMYGDDASQSLSSLIKPVTNDSYDTEYNDLIINIRVVKDTQQACEHIEKHGTHHSESIISEDIKEVTYFFNHIDSACLYHNASTRFTDGFEFGLGAEIGISTQKLHARGPMGLQALTTYTYHLEGNGEIRQ